MVTVRRENWKHKFVSVSRSKKGRIITWQKWNPKNPISKLKTTAKQTGGLFSKEMQREVLTNVTEISDFRIGAKKPKKRDFQFVMKATLKDGSQVVARSKAHPNTFSREKAKKEALESFFERLAQSQGLNYDAAEGKAFLRHNPDSIKGFKEGIISYVKV